MLVLAYFLFCGILLTIELIGLFRLDSHIPSVLFYCLLRKIFII